MTAIKREIRVRIVPTDRPLNTMSIAREIAQQIRKGNTTHGNDTATKTRRTA